MAVTQERFVQGMTYEEYKAQMTRNQERFDANEASVELDPAQVAFFAALPQPLNVLVLAEDWCGDVINNLPVLGRLAAASGKLNLRIFLRDQNLDLMDQYLKEGQHRSIPVFVFFDAAFHELGHWIERPARINNLQSALRQELFASDPLLKEFKPETPMAELSDPARDRLRGAFASFREQHRGQSDAEVVSELRGIVEHGSAQAAEAPVISLASVGKSTNGSAATVAAQPKVSITYCAECGYEPQTLALAGALMQTFVHDLALIELIPWQDGAFDVVINGDLVHSMYRDGGFPEAAAIIEAVRARMN